MGFKVFLVGFMGVGKTTVGKKISKKNDFFFEDTDKLIELREKMSISDIFKLKGETYFRELESKILEELIEKNQNLIISTGGGLPFHNQNLELMLNNGLVIFLNAPFKLILDRISNSKNTRPLLTDPNWQEIAFELFHKRSQGYNKAHVEFDVRNFDVRRLELACRIIRFYASTAE